MAAEESAGVGTGASEGFVPPAMTNSSEYLDRITKFVVAGSVLSGTHLCVGQYRRGKVRDVYTLHHEDKVIIVTTDRLSAFDRVLCKVPFKGAVLNTVAAWWFARTAHICPNHLVDVPHPNVTIARKTRPLPIEFVVRAYMTGSTSTSLWTHYKAGALEYCGNKLPQGLRKNDKLPEPIITPTTKEDEHDRPIGPKEIVGEGWYEVWEKCRDYALALFRYGQETASSAGLILVDTKYEFGIASDGEIIIIDEVHTPDSSRYWLLDTYAERHAMKMEPDNIDKEFVRLWYRQHCDPYRDPVLPEAPTQLVAELSRRYTLLYELITGQPFAFPDTPTSVQPSIVAALRATFPSIGRGRTVVVADGPAAAEASA
ncbi:purC, partial [Symbiodinium sp. KB8]